MRNGFEDLDLARLRRRRSEKWRLHPPDVLPAYIAEMDYDLAEPVLAALRAAVDLSDCGYAFPAGVGEAFAGFAAARHGWAVDPGLVHLIPDVMAGTDLIFRLTTSPGDSIVVNPPVYPPFFEHIAASGRKVAEVPPWGACSASCPRRASTGPGCSACWPRWPRGARAANGWTG